MNKEQLKEGVLNIGIEGYRRGFESGVESCKAVIRMVFSDAMAAEKLCEIIDKANACQEDA